MSSILFLSHTPRTSVFRVGSHHLSRSMAEMGHLVAHVTTPYSFVHRALRPGQRDRAIGARRGVHRADGVADLIPSPLLPANLHWSLNQMRRAMQATGIVRPDLVFIDQPLFRAEHFPESVVVFRPTDLFPSGLLTARALDVTARSDAIVATSPGVLDAYDHLARGPREVVENGVEFDRFRSVANTAKMYDFVYVGAIDDRFDLETLIDSARALTHATFAIFGPTPSRLPPHPRNLEFRGPVSYSDSPRAMARGRWGIMPFTASGQNEARSPMKLYEYLAAGLPVIAPESILQRVTGLQSGHAFDPAIPGDLTDKLTACLQQGPQAVEEADLQLSRNMDWSSVAVRLLRIAEETAIMPRTRIATRTR